MKILKSIIFSISFFITFSATGCVIPDLQHYINFGPTDTTIGSKKAKEIAKWLIFWREREGIKYIIIFSESIKNNQHFNAISNQRIQNITSLITPLLEEQREIKYGRTSHDPSASLEKTKTINEIQISIQPQCKRSGNCCGGNSR